MNLRISLLILVLFCWVVGCGVKRSPSPLYAYPSGGKTEEPTPTPSLIPAPGKH